MTTLEVADGARLKRSPRADEARRRWSIVLAGGEGRRMAGWVQDRVGERRPKQFCAFIGSRTMLQHTLDRAVRLVSEDQVITAIGHGQGIFLPRGGGPEVPGRVVEQPADRGTAAGVLLAATHVRERDPEATVLILPSDHFIHPDRAFCRHAAHACWLADRFQDRFVLLGAIAEGAETDYGWILPERRRHSPMPFGPGYRVWPVAKFREKPDSVEAAGLLRAGGLWNTLVVAVKVRALWTTARRLLPNMFERFSFLHRVLRAVRKGRAQREREDEVVQDIYLDMKPADFSRDLLQHVAASTLVQVMDEVRWSDWGRPERVESTLRHGLPGRSPVGAAPSASPERTASVGTAAAVRCRLHEETLREETTGGGAR